MQRLYLTESPPPSIMPSLSPLPPFVTTSAEDLSQSTFKEEDTFMAFETTLLLDGLGFPEEPRHHVPGDPLDG